MYWNTQIYLHIYTFTAPLLQTWHYSSNFAFYSINQIQTKLLPITLIISSYPNYNQCISFVHLSQCLIQFALPKARTPLQPP